MRTQTVRRRLQVIQGLKVEGADGTSKDCLLREANFMSDKSSASSATFDDFMKIDIRAGTIVSAEPFPEARKPAFKLVIDFGPDIGTRKSSAQITELYDLEGLVGKKVMAVVNFPPRQIGPFMSEVLTLGVANSKGEVVLISPDSEAPDGSRMH